MKFRDSVDSIVRIIDIIMTNDLALLFLFDHRSYNAIWTIFIDNKRHSIIFTDRDMSQNKANIFICLLLYSHSHPALF